MCVYGENYRVGKKSIKLWKNNSISGLTETYSIDISSLFHKRLHLNSFSIAFSIRGNR